MPHLDPVPCTTSLGWVIVAWPSRFISNSSWTVRGGQSECRAADVVHLPLMPYGGAAVEIGFIVLKVSWFHRFHSFIGFIRFVVSWVSSFCRFHGFKGSMA